MVALAGGPAFTFAYAETTECLEAAGADVAVVDPLRDEQLPEGTAAVVLPGGFPEVYVDQLSANAGFVAALRGHLGAGRPAYAECAGLLVLCEQLDGRPMVGHVPAAARMTERLTLGYRTAVAAHDTLVAPAGTTVHGHEFHRTVVEPASGTRPAWLVDGVPEGFVGSASVASYLHLHPAGVPTLATGIVAAARRTVAA